MEGRKCEEADCNISDFLPFLCSRCNHYYCLEHRSRFIHRCQTTGLDMDQSTDMPHIISNNQYLQGSKIDVEKTDCDQEFSNPPTHFQLQSIHSKASNKLLQHSEKFTNKLNFLDKSISSAFDEKEKAIGLATRKMLIRRKASGKVEIPLNERFYLIFHTTPISHLQNDGSEVNLQQSRSDSYFFEFFKSSVTLAEVLTYLCRKYPQLLLPLDQTMNIQDPTLAIQTKDTTDWMQWNYNVAISHILSDFEDVWLLQVPLGKMMEVISKQDNTITGRTATNETATISNPDAKEVIEFRKGQQAWYYRGSPCLDSVENAKIQNRTLLLVDIIDVHHDDFPNTYYTVKLHNPMCVVGPDTELQLTFYGHEKQTDGRFLIPKVEEVKNSAENLLLQDNNDTVTFENYQSQLILKGAKVKITVKYKKQTFPDVDIGLDCTVYELKKLISLLCKIHCADENDITLICKSVNLKDPLQVLSRTKVTNGSCLLVIK